MASAAQASDEDALELWANSILGGVLPEDGLVRAPLERHRPWAHARSAWSALQRST